MPISEKLRYLHWNNLSGPDTVASLDVHFIEPVGTYHVRTKFEPDVPRLYMEERWSDDFTELILTLIVLPGQMITDSVNTIYTISGLRSHSGNDFIIGYDVNGERIIKNTLDFRFTVPRRGQ
jgi:hypothetical protein